MFSVALEPLKARVSKPAWPSTTSLPSPAFQTEEVVAGAEQGDVVAVAAGDRVVAVAADEDVGAEAADDRIVAGAAVERRAEWRPPAAARR